MEKAENISQGSTKGQHTTLGGQDGGGLNTVRSGQSLVRYSLPRTSDTNSSPIQPRTPFLQRGTSDFHQKCVYAHTCKSSAWGLTGNTPFLGAALGACGDLL